MKRAIAVHLLMIGLLGSTAASGAPILTGALISPSPGIPSVGGPVNDTVWLFEIDNPQAAPVTHGVFDSLTLQQVSGAACTPIVSSLPLALGAIPGNGTVDAALHLDFTGCPDGNQTLSFENFLLNNGMPPILGATFDVTATFSGDGGAAGTLFIAGEGRWWQPVSPVSSSAPEPATLALFGIGVAGIAASRRRKLQ